MDEKKIKEFLSKLDRNRHKIERVVIKPEFLKEVNKYLESINLAYGRLDIYTAVDIYELDDLDDIDYSFLTYYTYKDPNRDNYYNIVEGMSI